MKTLFTIIFLFVSILLWGQNYTQKYNKLYDRTEFYNSYGNLIGYAKHNSLYNRLEYYDANGNLLKTEQYNSLYDRKDFGTCFRITRFLNSVSNEIKRRERS